MDVPPFSSFFSVPSNRDLAGPLSPTNSVPNREKDTLFLYSIICQPNMTLNTNSSSVMWVFCGQKGVKYQRAMNCVSFPLLRDLITSSIVKRKPSCPYRLPFSRFTLSASRVGASPAGSLHVHGSDLLILRNPLR